MLVLFVVFAGLVSGFAQIAGKTMNFLIADPDLSVFPVCTVTVTANCAIGYNVYDTTATRTKLNAAVIPIPVGATATTQDPFTSVFTRLGTSTVVATELYKDFSGAQKETGDSIPLSFQITKSAPTITAAP